MILYRIAGACVVAAVITSALSMSTAYAGGQGQGPPDSTATPEISALESEGLSPTAARQAIAAQERVTQANLADKVEAVMGSGFGGLWFEAATAKLHIGVTSPAGRKAAQAIVAQEGLEGDVALTEVRSTRAELGAAQERWDNKLAGLFGGEGKYETAILPQVNAVSVKLSSAVPASTRGALEREASSDSVNVSIVVVPAAQLVVVPAANKTVCNLFKKNEADCNPSITSGVSIGRANTSICTAGPLTIPVANKNARTLLTAGHCGEKGEAWNAWNTKGEEGKIGAGGTFNFNLEGDYGEIPIELAGPWSFGGATPVFAVTAQWVANEKSSWPVKGEKKPKVGESDCHDGQTSGGTCGKIIAEGVHVEYLVDEAQGKVKVGGLVEDEGPELVIEKGDSGGPFYFREEATKEVLMEGILSGFRKERANGIALFQPLKPVLEKLNLELLTTANEEIKAAAGWMVNGTNLTGTKALATTAAVDKVSTLTAGGVTVTCSGSTLNSVSPVINGATEMGNASSLEFTSCAGNTVCLLGGSTIKTLPVLLDLTLDGALAVKGRFLATNSSKLLATLKFEGVECALAGTQGVTGSATVLAPTGQDERTLQQLNATSEESGSLKLGPSAATLTGSILVRLASGEPFSFL